jgi:hypothetical protein
LFLSGSPLTDEYSDVDLMVLSTREDRDSLEKEIFKIASKVGKVRAEIMGRPHTYVVVYEPHGIKLDYALHYLPEKPRPDKASVEILYDPDGIIAKLVENSAKLKWDIDINALRHHVKHIFVALAYFVSKVERGELWEARDTIEWYRNKLVLIEHILAERKPEGYRHLEIKLTSEKRETLEKTITQHLAKDEIYRNMDAILNYFQCYLQPTVEKLAGYPETYAEKMINHYHSKKQ